VKRYLMKLEFASENERMCVLYAAQWMSPPGRKINDDFRPMELGAIVARLAQDYLDSLRKPSEGGPGQP
jgi:hypothetical protein